jgi:inorganic pyrophosphatase
MVSPADEFILDLFRKPRVFRPGYKDFVGSPRRHPQRDDRIILITDPFTPEVSFMEFELDDVDYVEPMPGMVDDYGELVVMARLWVKKGSLGVRSSLFMV